MKIPEKLKEVIAHNQKVDAKLEKVKTTYRWLMIVLWAILIGGVIFSLYYNYAQLFIPLILLFVVIIVIVISYSFYYRSIIASYQRYLSKEKELKELYEHNLIPLLKDFEKQRKVIRIKTILLMIVLSIPIGILVRFSFELDDGEGINDLIGLILAGGFYIYAKIIASYRKNFKAKIIQRIVALFDEKLTYYPKKTITRKEFKASKLERYWNKFNKWNGEDYIEGTFGKTAVKFSEIHAKYTSGKNTNTIFKGLFFIIDFNKHFEGFTVVLPEGTDGDDEQLVKLESPNFERAFVVYSDNQITARYVLSPNLMHRILRFYRELHQQNIYLSFVGGTLYIAIPISKPIFEPTVFNTLLNFKIYRDYLMYIQFSQDIVDELNLNTRIWSKKQAVTKLPKPPVKSPILNQKSLQKMIGDVS
ncbi:DUF3137 domain-containing protein [Candidatus Parabeggiatoa sp. HSG14]|uniref:DUF3137 domain-containing protein n=1 Tax=Candidatus Parabeggiatoa sp. HSG14 TaxID=3055593 RepID=UPI0025A91CCC|nr:DUF3137 domain-containing protein [Thiotrichales bacterium HSG14]